MTHKKQDLKQLSIKKIQNEIQKKEVARKDEINHIKHRCHLARIAIQYNPLTYFYCSLSSWLGSIIKTSKPLWDKALFGFLSIVYYNYGKKIRNNLFNFNLGLSSI